MTERTLYIDLLITNGSFTLNSGNEPVLCDNRESIAQDVVHMIIESSLARRLVGERSAVLRYDILQQLEELVESDDRIVPGTVSIPDSLTGDYVVSAQTWDFGPISRGIYD